MRIVVSRIQLRKKAQHPVTTEQNKTIVLQFYRAFDSRNLDQALVLLAPNFVAYMAGVPKPLNYDGFKQFGLVFYLAFPDGQHTFDQVITERDKVVTCGTFTGTHQGELQGIPPTGKQVKFSVMHIDQIEDGKIVKHWGQGDTLGLMQQLGIISLPSLTLYPKIFKSLTAKLFKQLASWFGSHQ